MSERMALKIAIDLMHVPSKVRLQRAEPLPEGASILLRIAAGDPDAESAAIDLTGRSPEVIRRSAAFFIEQILFAPDADSYRVLGADRQASPGQLRHNVALLLRWLHPDVDRQGDRSVFVSRVTAAWNNLKTPDRRAAYDELCRARENRRRHKKRLRRRSNGAHFVGVGPLRNGFGSQAVFSHDNGQVGFLRRALALLFYRPRQ